MVKVSEREEVFLSVLGEESDKNKIEKRIQYFNVSDWQRLYELATKNGLFPIFYHRLLSLRLENLPTDFLSKLQNLYFFNLKRNIFLEQELLKILAHLEKNNIPVIPLKGPVLAKFLYNDLALRQASCDLDLLVRYEGIEDTENILKEIGYVPLQQNKVNFFHRFRKQIVLSKRRDNQGVVSLDLHWDFRDRFTPTHLQAFWLNSSYIQLDGYKVLLPSQEDIFLFLVLTSISDFDFVQLKYLYDIHRLVMRFKSRMQWADLLWESKKLGLDTAVFFALRFCKDLFHTDIAEEFLYAARPKGFKEQICRRCINKNNILISREKTASTYVWRHFISSYLYSKNIFDCIKTICKRIFLPMEEFKMAYINTSSQFLPVLYIKRLLKPILGNFKKGAVRNERQGHIKKESRYCFSHH